jgi:hypothetical protein
MIYQQTQFVELGESRTTQEHASPTAVSLFTAYFPRMVCLKQLAFNQMHACIGFKVTRKEQHSSLFQQAINVSLNPSSVLC